MEHIDSILAPLSHCETCPRECGVNRFSDERGFCNSGAGYYVSSVCLHTGEEPAVNGKEGICNVFFSHCNLQCVYCQNYQISGNAVAAREKTLDEVADSIVEILERGCNRVGFVSPSHFIPQMKAIIFTLNRRGYDPVIVFNTNGYDKVEVVKSLDGIVDIYLPDFKYLDPKEAKRLSKAGDYPEVIKKSLKEMYRQKGSTLIYDQRDEMVGGLIIRHLVIPGMVKQSVDVLTYIAEEISTSVRISLMAQYFPSYKVKGDKDLGRTLAREEYEKVAEALEELGFRNGWLQELESNSNYQPDFTKKHPFI